MPQFGVSVLVSSLPTPVRTGSGSSGVISARSRRAPRWRQS